MVTKYTLSPKKHPKDRPYHLMVLTRVLYFDVLLIKKELITEWVSDIRQPDQLSNDKAPSSSHSSQPTRGRRIFRRVVPLEEEDTPEGSSVNVDIFTKVTRTDPATGDIVLVRYRHNGLSTILFSLTGR